MLLYRLCPNIGAKQAGTAGVARRNEKWSKWRWSLLNLWESIYIMIIFSSNVSKKRPIEVPLGVYWGWNLEGKK
jgi:hypothetical protein